MGERHIFIRFEACPMACAYCDESDKKAGKMSLVHVLQEVTKLEKKAGPHAYVSLTGGEPLLYADFLKPLCAALKRRSFRILLETSGVLWRELSRIVEACDTIAMDFKLSSVTRQKDFLKEHKKFLEIAKRKETYIKIVVSKGINVREYDRHLHMAARVAPQVPVFLQPVSHGKGSYPDPGLMRLLDKLQRIGAKRLSDVRVGIQLQKLMNIR